MKVKALMNTLPKILGHKKVKTLGGNVETETLVDALVDTHK